MQQERVMEEYSIDLLTKYAVAGHTDHIDSSSGRVREAPPFEAVASELADIGACWSCHIEDRMMSSKCGHKESELTLLTRNRNSHF